MANPTKPKDAKPRAEQEDVEIKNVQKVPGAGVNPIIIGVIVALVISLITVGANYFIMNMMLSQKLAAISTPAEGEEGAAAGEEEEAAPERGIILDLGEFILNLADTNARKFLKVDVAIELSKKETDPSLDEKPKGGGGHGEGAPADPMKEIEEEMNQYKPAIRDSVISILSSKTAEELATTPGKELAKEQIKESINAVFNGEREVLRVSFGSFFIQ